MNSVRTSRALNALVAALIAGATIPMSHATDERGADDRRTAGRPALTVTGILPVREQLPQRLQANGGIAAWDEAVIGSEAAGLRLVDLRAAVGDRVRRGDVLAVFASDTIRAELAQSHAGLAEAEVAVDEAAANADRARQLQGSDALSAAQISQYLNGERSARARADAARALVRLHEARLAQTRLLAPDDGIISARTASIGSVPAPGIELFRLIRQGRLEWRAEVTADELAGISLGVRAQVTATSGITVEGKVRTLSPTVDPQTRHAIVYVDLPSMTGASAHGLRPGSYARGSFELGSLPALLVPQSALAVRDGFSFVYRIDADQRVSQLKVQTGRIVGDRVEIRAGLSGTETLVSSGAGFLNDGDRVRVLPAAAPRR